MSDTPPLETLTVDLFAPELRTALRSYERHIVCLEQVPEEAESALRSLVEKAIQAFQNRASGLKHGIAQPPHACLPHIMNVGEAVQLPQFLQFLQAALGLQLRFQFKSRVEMLLNGPFAT